MNRLSQYIPSTEAIDHQYDGIFKQALINRINTIRKGTVKIDKAIIDADLGKLIGVHTGINVEIKVVKGIAAQIQTMAISPNHPIINEMRTVGWDKSSIKAYLRARDITGGEVDLAKGKVSGSFTKVDHLMYVGTTFFTRKNINGGFEYSTEEIAAVIMHEMGHAFTYFELTGRTVRTNYIILGAVQRLLSEDDRAKRIQLIMDVEGNTGFVVGDKDRLVDINKDTAYATALLKASMDKCRSELGVNLYDNTGSESLADQYAARQGLAVPLATALSKMLREYGHRDLAYSQNANLLFNILQFSSMVITLAAPVGGAFLLVKALVAAFNISAFLNTGKLADEYDRPKERLERLRSQLVEQLKDKSIPADIRASISDDVDKMDDAMSYINNNVHWLDFVSEYVIPYKRKEVKQVEFQKGLEKMLNNELFVSAAKLETLKV